MLYGHIFMGFCLRLLMFEYQFYILIVFISYVNFPRGSSNVKRSFDYAICPSKVFNILQQILLSTVILHEIFQGKMNMTDKLFLFKDFFLIFYSLDWLRNKSRCRLLMFRFPFLYVGLVSWILPVLWYKIFFYSFSAVIYILVFHL